MKKYIVTFLVFTFLLSINYAQETDKVSVEEYSKYLQKIKNEYVTQNRISEIDINEAKKMVYLAYHTTPIAVKQLLWDEHNEIREKSLKRDREAYIKLQLESKYTIGQHYISNLLHDELIVNLKDTLQYNLIWHTNLMIKGKVIEKEVKIRPSNNQALPPLKLVHLKIQVEDVLMGNAKIDNKTTIIETYFNQRLVTTDMIWKINETYLFNLNYTEQSVPLTRILTYGNYGIFPIKNEILFDKTDFFEFGENIEWNDFKKEINAIINNIIK